MTIDKWQSREDEDAIWCQPIAKYSPDSITYSYKEICTLIKLPLCIVYCQKKLRFSARCCFFFFGNVQFLSNEKVFSASFSGGLLAVLFGDYCLHAFSQHFFIFTEINVNIYNPHLTNNQRNIPSAKIRLWDELPKVLWPLISSPSQACHNHNNFIFRRIMIIANVGVHCYCAE